MGKVDFVSGAKMEVVINAGPFEGKTGRTVKAFASSDTPGSPAMWSVAVQGYQGMTFPIKSTDLTFRPPSKAMKALTDSQKPGAKAPKPAYIITTISSSDLKVKPKY